ncbi:hypothetical protein [Eubacterium aggregans]|uniref:hypothetical protein n=1 Tax=Eubacterium aggregans TaxID=81409 RepID=UPI003F2BD5BC
MRSKGNEGRVRGVRQDSNNKTTDIVEWEELEIEPQEDYYEPERVELTPEQQVLAEAIGHAVANVVLYGAEQLNNHVIKPWWRNNAKPWIKERTADIKQIFSGKTKAETILKEQKKSNSTVVVDTNTPIDKMLDREFDSIQFDMSSEEARQHVIKLIYHILGTVYEIRILSNARIVEQVEDEEQRLKNQSKAEHLLYEKVANNINELLSDENLLNGEYIPVELDKVSVAIGSMRKSNEK